MNPDKQAMIVIGILVVITIFILVLLIAKPKEDFSYNDYEIQKVQEQNYIGYKTQVFINRNGPYQMNTRFHPRDLEDISIEEKLRPSLDNKTESFIHVTNLNESFTGQTSIAAIELDGLIEKFYSIPVGYEDNQYDCSKADTDTLVIDFRLSDRNHISEEENCIIAEGITQEDFVRLSDRIVFHLLGIMD